MSIGTGWHARLWVTFALTARCIAAQATQSGCNSNGPRVPCGKCNIKMLALGVLFPRRLALKVCRGPGGKFCGLLSSLSAFYILNPDVTQSRRDPGCEYIVWEVQVHSP